MGFDDIDLETNGKKAFEALVERALSGKPSPFSFIRTRAQAKIAKWYKSGVKKIAKTFKRLYYGVLKGRDLDKADDPETLAAVSAAIQFKMCHDYYMNEYAIAKDMLSEYGSYVRNGHRIAQTIFGETRSEEECVDYRRLPWKLF